MKDRPLRILTAVAAFDGHDASVLALNRALLEAGRALELIYLGFNMRSEQIALAALQEGADAVAVSSYNGGHLEFFPHLLRRLRQLGLAETLLFGGGGGTILPQDEAQLEAAGVEKIYGPGWSLTAAAKDMLERTLAARQGRPGPPDPGQELALSLASGPARAARRAWAESGRSRTLLVAGEGGSGKSTLIDELVRRFLAAFPAMRIAILANDPTLKRGGGETALLADRVRMNSIYHARVWMRSVATGSPYAPLSPALPTMLDALRGADFDLILMETPGTGQSGLDASALGADVLLAVKTRESGSGLQLHKDQLLRDADLVALNKADQEGARAAFGELQGFLAESNPGARLFPVIAKAAGDPGLDALFAALCGRLGREPEGPAAAAFPAALFVLVPHGRRAYLAEIASNVRAYDAWVSGQLQQLRQHPEDPGGLDPACARLLDQWPQLWQRLSRQAAEAQGIAPVAETQSGYRLPRVALPDPRDKLESLRFLLEEGLPGQFPFVTGLHPYRHLRGGETTRQFAGLRGPEETNRRLHLLANGVARPRLSIAFDGITLYGADSDEDEGSAGKIGEGGVAIDSWEDMKRLLAGFSIPEISTSMTINGPAPVILAMYFVAAFEFERERCEKEAGAPLSEAEEQALRKRLLGELRGTVQADILKEVQAQNESIFQPDFAIRLLGDVQQWFIENGVRRFYSLSVSGYHIGEAGATPAQELAFTLANGFTYVENFLSRGMKIDAFAPSLSFFFRVSHEAEWLAFGAVCRKIWAIALRDRYGASERSQHLRFHTQTSGRALQAQEWDSLNPLRLVHHALLGLLADTNSLHVDSADEPMTTPSQKWVRQAGLIPNYLREEAEIFLIQNLLSGSYAFRTLMAELQQEILAEFERIDALGGVGPATELGYQRRAIAESSARYEAQRSRAPGEEPRRRIIGYNVFELPEGHPDKFPEVAELARCSPQERELQLARVRNFKARHRKDGPEALERLKQVARGEGNVFGELLTTVRHASLGQICGALAEVGGRFRKMV